MSNKDDCISRQMAIDLFPDDGLEYDTKGGYVAPHLARQMICELPSAQPEQKWIPVTERLPEDDTLMLVNYIDSRPDAMDIWIGWHEMENVWYIDGEEHSRGRGNEVIAWMPLPASYKGEQHDW